MKNFLSLVVVITSVLVGYVSAEELVSSSSASSAATKKLEIFEVFIFPGNSIYTKEMAAQGVQGSSLISLKLDEAFMVNSAELFEKSRDETIDKMALAFFSRPKLRMGFKEGDRYQHDLVKITFAKDDLMDFKNKTCGDAIIDGDYFKKIYPEKDYKDLRFWESTSGLMYILYLDKSKKPLDTNKTFERVFEECKLHPEKNVFDTYRALAQFN